MFLSSSGIVLHALKQSTLSSLSSMVIMETETNQNCAEQRVKQLNVSTTLTTLITCTSLAPKTAIQIKDLDYYHHFQIDFCCLGFLDLSNWILILSSFITRDICRVSLVVLLLHSTTRSFFITYTLTHTNSECFLIL